MEKRNNNKQFVHFGMDNEIIRELDNIRTNYNIKTDTILTRTTLINYICSVFVDDFLNSSQDTDKKIVSLFMDINRFKGVIE